MAELSRTAVVSYGPDAVLTKDEQRMQLATATRQHLTFDADANGRAGALVFKDSADQDSITAYVKSAAIYLGKEVQLIQATDTQGKTTNQITDSALIDEMRKFTGQAAALQR